MRFLFPRLFACLKPHTILFAGGGSLGHITPSVAIWDAMQKAEPSLRGVFVCSKRLDEAQYLSLHSLTFFSLSAARFPGGITLRWLSFPLAFLWSCVQSYFILKNVRPSAVFSKGGSIAVPLSLIGWCLSIPVIHHFSDSVPNKSDRIIMPLATKSFSGFPCANLGNVLVEQSGNPVRSIFKDASKTKGMSITKFSGKRPVVMMIGGSQGAQALNEEIDRIFHDLIDIADVIHLTGVGKELQKKHARYFARSMVYEDLPHLMALSDIMITRAGAGVLSEIANVQKPAIVIPLEGVAHNHQVENAKILAGKGAIVHLPQQELSNLLSAIKELLAHPKKRETLAIALHQALPSFAEETIAKAIVKLLV